MHDLALALVGAGHEVTYLTMRHWDDEPPTLPGVTIVGLVPAGAVYADERRSLGPPARFGARGRPLPPSSRLPVRRRPHWRRSPTSRSSPRPSSGAAGATGSSSTGTRSGRGATGSGTPDASSARSAGSCSDSASASSSSAFCISRLTDRRLVEEGFTGTHSILPGLYAGRVEPSPGEDVQPLVVYAGRHVGEKRIPLLVEAFAHARRQLPELRLELFGDGPDRAARRAARRDSWGSGDSVLVRRPTAAAGGRAGVRTGSVRRDGVGARGIRPRRRRGSRERDAERRRRRGRERRRRARDDERQRRRRAAHATPESLGDAIVAVVRGGASLRATTSSWFAAHAHELRLERSLEVVLAVYAGDSR